MKTKIEQKDKKYSLYQINKELFSETPKVKSKIFFFLSISFIIRLIPLFLGIITSLIINSFLTESIKLTPIESLIISIPLSITTMYVLVKISEIFLSLFQKFYIVDLMTAVSSTFLQKTFEKLSKLPKKYLTNKDPNTLSTLLNKRTEIINGFSLLFSFLIPLFLELFFISCFLILIKQFLLASIFSLAIVVIIFFRFKITEILVEKITTLFKAQSKIVFHSNETISKMYLAQIFKTENFLVNLRKEEEQKEIKAYKKYKYIFICLDFLQDIMITITVVAIFIAGIQSVEENKISIGIFISLFSLISNGLFQLKNSFFAFEGVFSLISSTQPHMEIIYNFKQLNTIETPTEYIQNNKKQNIHINNLSFSYGEQETLKNISFDINLGEKIFLVGLSGAGKTTLLKILLGLEEKQVGTINFTDGSEAHNAFGTVPQNLELFTNSIKNNLLLGNSRATEEEMFKILNLVNLSETIKNKGLDSPISNLSGGEQQRLAIARALISHKQFIILDEPTSSLDLHNEKKIIQELINNKELTAIISIHRIQSIPSDSKVIVLDKGQISQIGTFSNLSREPNGLLYKLLKNAQTN